MVLAGNPDKLAELYSRFGEKVKDEGDGTARKKCNTCGHVYCYALSEIGKNAQIRMEVNTIRAGNIRPDSIGGALFTGTTYAVENELAEARAERLEDKIVDYSVCPRCKSGNLRSLSKEDYEKEMQPSYAPQAIPAAASSADELLKFKSLLDSGVITQEEFDAKKKQLLGL